MTAQQQRKGKGLSVTSYLGYPLHMSWMARESVEDGMVFFNVNSGMLVVETIVVDGYTERWHRVSYSFRDRMPNREETREIKRLFIGANKRAVQVLPPENEPGDRPFVLTLWECLDGDPFPSLAR